jgi:hypothetical protein
VAEPTLALARVHLRAAAGDYLGYGRGNDSPYADSAWTTNQAANIDDTVASGLRRFYWPATGHEWSFLKPPADLSLTSGTQAKALPDDFAFPDGDVTVSSPAGSVWWKLRFAGEGEIREAYSRYATAPTGRPEMVAVRPIKGTAANAGQRWEFYFFPQADQSYTVRFRYAVSPDALTSGLPYPYGGAAHAATIEAAVLAAAEWKRDNYRGPMEAAFQERLAASIALDNRLKPGTIGVVGDPSTGWHRRGGAYRHWPGVNVQYDGILYDGNP